MMSRRRKKSGHNLDPARSCFMVKALISLWVINHFREFIAEQYYEQGLLGIYIEDRWYKDKGINRKTSLEATSITQTWNLVY